MSPVVIDLDEIRAQSEFYSACDSCPSTFAVVVADGGWDVGVMHMPDCPRVDPQPPEPKPRLSLVRTGGVA